MSLDEPRLAKAVRTLARAEPRFAQIVKRHGPPPLWPRDPGFQTLVLLQLEQRALDLDAIAALPDADAGAALDALHGVGPWTADCYLLFALRRADVFPAADLALMESVRQLWRLRARPTPLALARRAQAWRPHRAVAARLLWHHYLSERGRT